MASPKRLSCYLASLAAATLLPGAQPAKAILTYHIYEASGDVVMKTSGSLNLSGPAYYADRCATSPGGTINTALALFCTGQDTSGYNYYAVTGPVNISGISGTVSASPANFVSGLKTIVHGGGRRFYIDPSYLSGPIVGSATFSNNTLTAMGFTTTGLIGSWTLNTTGDTINVVVGAPPTAAAPGPLPLFGAAAAFGFGRRLRRRVNRSRRSRADRVAGCQAAARDGWEGG
jgi:peptidoglycan hydrolase-like protein with peptidoglycan-binding domain